MGLDALIHPVLLYLACGLGGVGVALALPRRGYSLKLVGGVLAAVGAGLVVLMLSLRAGEGGQLPNVYFYVFGAMALGSAFRVVTHPRPIYSALYFILTILAAAGLLLILSAEFMAFALIIIYAGAILITYLFVIMLATQAPTEGDEDLLAEYDVEAREPWVASVVGFVMLAVLTTMVFRGAGELGAPGGAVGGPAIAELPRKVERELRAAGAIEPGERLEAVSADGAIVKGGGGTRAIARADWPEGLEATNVESLGINLLRDHPMTIEIAGVILLMAMLGATVLARKQVELEEEAKASQERLLHDARTLRMEGEA